MSSPCAFAGRHQPRRASRSTTEPQSLRPVVSQPSGSPLHGPAWYSSRPIRGESPSAAASTDSRNRGNSSPRSARISVAGRIDPRRPRRSSTPPTSSRPIPCTTSRSARGVRPGNAPTCATLPFGGSASSTRSAHRRSSPSSVQPTASASTAIGKGRGGSSCGSEDSASRTFRNTPGSGRRPAGVSARSYSSIVPAMRSCNVDSACPISTRYRASAAAAEPGGAASPSWMKCRAKALPGLTTRNRSAAGASSPSRNSQPRDPADPTSGSSAAQASHRSHPGPSSKARGISGRRSSVSTIPGARSASRAGRAPRGPGGAPSTA